MELETELFFKFYLGRNSPDKNRYGWLGVKHQVTYLPGADAPHVYVRAWTLFQFHSLISTQNAMSLPHSY